jgi:tetratricopeptide (TPR) repeat protein
MANHARTKPKTAATIETESNLFTDLQSKYERSKKKINTTVFIVLVLALGIVGYIFMYKNPRENDAAKAVFYAEQYFAIDSSNLVLNGDGQHKGVLSVMKKYSGTKVANLCHYYAGISYLKLGDYSNAVKNLKDFKGEGTDVGIVAAGSLGDAYMMIDKTKEAIEQYNKAAARKDDIVFAPIYLQRLAMAYEKNNQPEEAAKAYKRILDEFPQSSPARDVAKSLARLGTLD